MVQADDTFEPEVFARGPYGFKQLDTYSDAGRILDVLQRPFDIMRFRLVYDGELKAAGKNPRGPEKWALRKRFRPQLASLAVTHPVMRGVALTTQHISGGTFAEAVAPVTVDVHVSSPHAGTQNALLEWVDVGGHSFIPLVRKSLALVCELDILFLRNDAPGSHEPRSRAGTPRPNCMSTSSTSARRTSSPPSRPRAAPSRRRR